MRVSRSFFVGVSGGVASFRGRPIVGSEYTKDSLGTVFFFFEEKNGAYGEVKVGIGYELVGGSDFEHFPQGG